MASAEQLAKSKTFSLRSFGGLRKEWGLSAPPNDQARPAEGAGRRAMSALRYKLSAPAIENTAAQASQRPGIARFPVAWIR